MKSQRIPEHKLNTTATAGQVVENMENTKSTAPSPSGQNETKGIHTNEAK